MPIKSLSQSSLLNFEKYSSLLAGNDPYIPFTSSYDLLETEILTGTQASVTFSSLNSTYGADYQHLQIRALVRSERAGNTQDWTIVRFNGDTGSNYARHSLNADGSGVYSSGSGSQTYADSIGTQPTTTNTAYSFAAGVIDILDPFDTSKNTTIRTLFGYTGSNSRVGLTSGLWNNTAALTSILLDQGGGTNYVSGCRFSLYGLKKASA